MSIPERVPFLTPDDFSNWEEHEEWRRARLKWISYATNQVLIRKIKRTKVSISLSEIEFSWTRVDDFAAEEIGAIFDPDVWLHIDPAEPFDLRRIAPALHNARQVVLDGDRDLYSGWEALEGANKAVHLLWRLDPGQQINLRSLEKLSTMWAVGEDLTRSAAKLSSLQSLEIHASRIPADVQLQSPLEFLEVHGARSLADLSFLADGSRLELLRIYDAASFDVASLRRARRLREVWFIDCAQLLNVDALVELPELTNVTIDGTRSMTRWEGIEGLDERVYLEVKPNRFFDDAFLARVSPRRWNIRPMRRPVVGAPQTAVPRLVDGAVVGPFQVESFDGEVTFVFDEWTILEDLAGDRVALLGGAGADLMERVVRSILDQDLPGTVDGERAYFDSEADAMRLVVTRRTLPRKIAGTLLDAWNTPQRFANAVQAELSARGA